MRRIRSISDYLSLGTLWPADVLSPPRPALMGARVTGGKPFERSDLVVAERLTIKHIRDAVAQLAEEGVPPMTEELNNRDPVAGHKPMFPRIPPEVAAGFGPWYEVRLPPQDMTALLADPEYLAGEAAGEFRVGGKGVVMVRPPMVAVDDTIDPATGKVVRRERNAIRLEEV